MSLSRISEQALTESLINAGFQKAEGFWRHLDDEVYDGIDAVFEVTAEGFAIEEKSRFSLIRYIGSVSDAIEMIPKYAQALNETGLDARYTLTEGVKSWMENDLARRGMVIVDHWGTWERQADFLHCVFVTLPDK